MKVFSYGFNLIEDSSGTTPENGSFHLQGSATEQEFLSLLATIRKQQPSAVVAPVPPAPSKQMTLPKVIPAAPEVPAGSPNMATAASPATSPAARPPVVREETPALAVAPAPTEKQSAPAVSVGENLAVPLADLIKAQSFRQVMTWMLANKFNTKELILEKCAQFKEVSPGIQRFPEEELPDRVERALTAMIPAG